MGIKTYFNVTMYPEMYLMETDDNTQCLSLLRPINDDQAAGFKLGAAFFRNVSIQLSYIDDGIQISTKDVQPPLATEHIYPEYDNSNIITIAQTIDSNGQYSGSGYMGNPVQGDGKKWAYSTTTYYSVVPDIDTISGGWYNTSASSSYQSLGLD